MNLTGVRRIFVPLVLSALACKDPSSPVPAPAALTSLPRDLSATEQKLIASSNTFAFDLLKQINTAQRDSNVFVSPLSASMALGMTANGAGGATYDAFRTALRWDNASKQEVNDGYKSLITLLTGLDPTTDIRIANSIWYERTFPVKNPFLSDSKEYFNAQVRPLDFLKQSSVDTINTWVSDATVKKIPTIIDSIDQDEVMFLINAIYFKGSWQQQFDKTETHDASFHSLDGKSQTTAMMHMKMKPVSAAQMPGFKAVDLPYGNSAFSMTLILPDSGTSVNSLAESLDVATWKKLIDAFDERPTDLYLPRFKMDWEKSLNRELTTMGLGPAFTGAADFSLISDAAPLEISRVVQKTFVKVDEEGTEAAAVTAVGIIAVSAPAPFSIRFDRPFIFAIRERFSGTVLFIGKVVEIQQ